jgi:hypothetical protein
LIVRYQTQCDVCGNVDDHPKLHYSNKTWHHDCVPSDIKAQILGNSSGQIEMLKKILAAPHRGVKGLDLHLYIQSIHQGEQNG